MRNPSTQPLDSSCEGRPASVIEERILVRDTFATTDAIPASTAGEGREDNTIPVECTGVLPASAAGEGPNTIASTQENANPASTAGEGGAPNATIPEGNNCDTTAPINVDPPPTVGAGHTANANIRGGTSTPASTAGEGTIRIPFALGYGGPASTAGEGHTNNILGRPVVGTSNRPYFPPTGGSRHQPHTGGRRTVNQRWIARESTTANPSSYASPPVAALGPQTREDVALSLTLATPTALQYNDQYYRPSIQHQLIFDSPLNYIGDRNCVDVFLTQQSIKRAREIRDLGESALDTANASLWKSWAHPCKSYCRRLSLHPTR